MRSDIVRHLTRKRIPAIALTVACLCILASVTITAHAARPEDDIATNRKKLENLNPAVNPSDWAAANFELGRAQTFLGLKENDQARLDEAISALNNSAEIWQRDSKPQKWVEVQLWLTRAHREKSRIAVDGTSSMLQALRHIADSVTLSLQAPANLPVRRINSEFAETISMAGHFSAEKQAIIRQWLQRSDESRAKTDQSEYPNRWAEAQLNHARVLFSSGINQRSRSMVQQSHDLTLKTITWLDSEGMARNLARARMLMARSGAELYRMGADIDLAEQAMKALNLARQYYKDRKDTEQLAQIDAQSGLVTMFLAEHSPDDHSAQTALKFLQKAEEGYRRHNLTGPADRVSVQQRDARRLIRALGHW